MSSSMGRSVDALNREVAALRARDKELREALARSAKQHEDDAAKIQRLQQRGATDSSAARITQLEQRLKQSQDEKQSLRVRLDEAQDLEVALRGELEVLQQMMEWEEFPDLRAAAVTTVRARELEARLQSAESQAEVSRRRSEELADEIRELTAALREGDGALLAAHAEIESLMPQVQEGLQAEAENSELRQRVADLEAELEPLRDEVGDLRRRVGKAEQEAVNHRASWHASREHADVTQKRADEAEEQLSRIQEEHARVKDELRDARREIEANALEIASLRRREAQWDDEHGLLGESRDAVRRLELDLTAERQTIEGLRAVSQHLERQQASDSAMMRSYADRVATAEERADKYCGQLHELQRDFVALERQAGNLSLELERTRVAAEQETTQARKRVEALETELSIAQGKLRALKAETAQSSLRVARAVMQEVDHNAAPSHVAPSTEDVKDFARRSPKCDSTENFTSTDAAVAAGSGIRASAAEDGTTSHPAAFLANLQSRKGLSRVHRRDFGSFSGPPAHSLVATPPRGPLDNGASQAALYHLSPQTPPPSQSVRR